jgi:hypothetical protein
MSTDAAVKSLRASSVQPLPSIGAAPWADAASNRIRRCSASATRMVDDAQCFVALVTGGPTHCLPTVTGTASRCAHLARGQRPAAGTPPPRARRLDRSAKGLGERRRRAYAGARSTPEREERTVPVFMVERRYAEELEVNAGAADGINRINDEEGVRWLYSFLSADKRKTYCLYEAPSADAIRSAAQRAGLPADVIVEVTDKVQSDGSLARL